VVAFILLFGRPMSFDHSKNPLGDPEPMRWCAIWSMLPLLALMVGSLLLHPMFQIRYVAPVVAGFSILAAVALNLAGARVRNLAGAAIASAFLILATLFHIYHQPFELWRRIARAVAANKSPSQEVIFEAGYVMGVGQAAGIDPDSLIEVLPDGYLRIPFDYYCSGTNPRRAINPFRPRLRSRDHRAVGAPRRGRMASESSECRGSCRRTPIAGYLRARYRVIYDESVSVSLYHIIPRRHDR